MPALAPPEPALATLHSLASLLDSWPGAKLDGSAEAECCCSCGSTIGTGVELLIGSSVSSSDVSAASSDCLSERDVSSSSLSSSPDPDCVSERSLSSNDASTSAFCQRDSHECTTSDGWRLHLTHVYDPTAEACSVRPQHPVLLVPGLASSGEHTFDLLPECSLVDVLVARGYDVWLADLRGNGRSQKPSVLDSSTWWTVDDHFLRDVPAVLEYVLAATGAKQVHWVGHSMGGMLAVGLLSQQHRLAGALRSVTLVASGCFGRGSWHSVLRPLISRITGWGFPAGHVCAAIGALAGRLAVLWPVEALFYWPSNMRRSAARKLMAGCFHYIPAGVIRQFMGSLNSDAGLSAADNSFRYADPAALGACAVPVLGLNGSWDLFCPAAGGRRTVELFGGPSRAFVCLGPSHGTAARHYGHFDIMSGRDAAREVFPHVLGWLDAHDGAAGGAAARPASCSSAQGAAPPGNVGQVRAAAGLHIARVGALCKAK